MKENEKLEQWAAEKFSQEIQDVERNPLQAQSARQRYLNAVDQHVQAVSNSASERLNHKAKTKMHFPRNAKEFGKMVGQVVMAMAIIVSLLGGTGAATVYASQDSLPGETLYPVKIWSEDVQLDLTADQEKKLDLSMDFTDRRLDEIQQLIQADLPVDETVVDTLAETMDESLEILDDIPEPATMDKLMTRLMTQQQLMIQDCDCLEEPLKLQIQEMMQTRIRAVENVKEAAQYQNENQNQQQYQTPGAKEPLKQQQQFQETALPDGTNGQGVKATEMNNENNKPENAGENAQGDGTKGNAGQLTRTPMGNQTGGGGGRP